MRVEAPDLECYLKFCAQGHPYGAVSRGDLANYLYGRFTQLGILLDLGDAISLWRNTSPGGRPDKTITLKKVVRYLYVRFTPVRRSRRGFSPRPDLGEALAS